MVCVLTHTESSVLYSTITKKKYNVFFFGVIFLFLFLLFSYYIFFLLLVSFILIKI